MANVDGLIKLRKATAKKPEHHCENCSCKRYTPCTCKRAEKKKKESNEVSK